jgi:hypothetical protein
MKLIYTATGEEVKVGDGVTLDKGENLVITSIEKPKHSGSTGRVYVELADQRGVHYARGYYPSVIGAKWVEREDQLEADQRIVRQGRHKMWN